MPKARLMTFSCGQVRPYAQLLVLNTLDSRVYSIQALFDSNSEIPTETIYSAVIDQFGSPDRTIIKQRGRTELGSFVIGVQYWDWTGVTMTVNVSKVYSDSNPWGVDTGLFVTDSNLERAAKKLEAEIKLRATEQQHLRSIAQKKRIHF